MQILTLDFETFYSADYSLSKLTTEEYIRNPLFKAHGAAISIDGCTPRWVTAQYLPRVLAQVDWDKTALLCHNAQFDGAILAWVYGHYPSLYLDTMCMARVGLPGVVPPASASLKSLAEHYGLPPKGDDLPISKGLRDLPPEIEARIAAYAEHDAWLTWALWRELSRGSPPMELRLIDLTVRMFTRPLLEVDQPVLLESLERIQSSKASLLAACGADRESLQSADKFAAILKAQGVTLEMKEGKRGPIPALAKTDDFMLSLMEHDNPTVQALAAARLGIKSTIDETRTERFLGIASRGPIPVQLRYYGAHTGRWSGDGKQNMQNLRRKSPLRECLVAPEGHVVVVADSAQIEARMLAWRAGHNTLLDAFRNKEDIYSQMGEQVGASRSVGKVLILGLGYGMGATKLQEALHKGPLGMPPIEVDLVTAKRWVDAYRYIHAPIPKLWRELESQFPRISLEGLPLPSGRVLHYKDMRYADGGWTYKGRKERVSTWGGAMAENVIQAMARDVVAEQMIEIAKRYSVVTMTHDEVVAIAPEDEAEEALAFMLDCMRKAPAWCADLPLNAEGGFAVNYSK